MRGNDSDLCIEAVKRIQDEKRLAGIAATDAPDAVCLLAQETVCDQNLLADILARARSANVRMAVISRVHNQNVLAQIAMSAAEAMPLREAAAAAITACTHATAIAVSSTDGFVRAFSGGQLVLQMDPEVPFVPIT